MTDDKFRETVSTVRQQYLYYIIIGLVSMASLCFLPMVGSSVGMEWNVPNTTVGWAVWIGVRLLISAINVMLFYCFKAQAKINVRGDQRYIDATAILVKLKKKEKAPRSPGKYQRDSWLVKGTTIFLSSAMATVALTQAILTYDWVSMLTYLFTIVMGIVFGVITMKSDEIYWTEEYYEYALIKQEENKNANN